MISRIAFTVLASTLLLGCGLSQSSSEKAAAKQAAAEHIYLFSCGQTPVKAIVKGQQKLTLYLEGRQVQLTSVPAASGAKYETAANVTPRIVFWNKGTSAMLETGNGRTLDCRQLTEMIEPLVEPVGQP